MLRQLVAAFTMALAAVHSSDATASGAKARAEFDVVVWDSDGSLGYTYVYHLTPSTLTVTLENDFGQPPKELCAVDLPSTVRGAWSIHLAKLPMERLADKYVNASVDDGPQLRFAIRRSYYPRRLIRVQNMYQPDLANLCQQLDALVSQTCVQRRLRMPHE